MNPPIYTRANLRDLQITLIKFAIAISVISGLAGCWKKSGEAILLEKEHIAIAEATPTPNEQSPASSPSPSPASDEEIDKPRELGPNEIDVDGYVMNKDVRGTGKDPRAQSEEQWQLRVRLISNRRIIDIRSDQAHFDKLKPGDHVQVTYREGKYTGTIWSARIE